MWFSICKILATLLILVVYAADSHAQTKLVDQNLRSVLQELVNAEARHADNLFFLSPPTQDKKAAYLLWREEQKIWILTPDHATSEAWRWSILRPSGGSLIDLRKDIVTTQDDIGTSTYLNDQAWAHDVVFQCVINGSPIQITKLKPNPAQD